MLEDLTVILTLKGRENFSQRWLDYMSQQSFNCSIIIADGDQDSNLQTILSQNNYLNLKIVYKKFNDTSWEDYYQKVNSCLKYVETKYVMISDNDDFLIKPGIQKIIGFLDQNDSYVSAGSNILFFSLDNKQNAISGKKCFFSELYSSPRPEEPLDCYDLQLRSVFQHFQPNFYNIYRTNTLRTIAEELSECNFSDPAVAEIYQQLRVPLIGKQKKILECVHYIRQSGTSSQGSSFTMSLIEKNLSQDIRELVKHISAKYVVAYPEDQANISEKIMNYYSAYLTHYIAHSHLRFRFPLIFKLKESIAKFRVFKIIYTFYLHAIHLRLLRNVKKSMGPSNFQDFRHEFNLIFNFMKK